jgi:hypothetical protein
MRITRFLVTALITWSLLFAPWSVLAGNVHSTPHNGRDHVHKIRIPRPQKHKHTVGMTRDQKFMDKHPVGREPPVHHFSRRERKAHQIHVQGGRLHKKDRAGNLVPYHTGNGIAKFVMKPSGKIIAHSGTHHTNGAPIQHSSLGKGKRVAGAGMMRVDRGKLVSINNHSGHYKPTPHHHDQVIRELKHRGVRSFKSTTGFGGSRRSHTVRGS